MFWYTPSLRRAYTYLSPQTKQLKLVPFPTYEPDNDVCMSDASSDQDLLTVDPHHGRFNSTSSAVSSDAESRMSCSPLPRALTF